MSSLWFRRLSWFTTVWALIVIILGAYVRLSDAGLGCPDWPGCYGQLTAPDDAHALGRAQEAFPEAEIHSGKAWKEMAHRYFAGTLGLLILGLAVVAWRHRTDPGQPRVLPIVLLLLVVFQALLGMWTVTMLLRPAIVTLHLLMGLTTLGLLFWQSLTVSAVERRQVKPAVALLATVGLAVLIGQIFLGGWVSTNYAALHCTDFPTCQGEWWPDDADFGKGFDLIGEGDVNHEGGRLPWEARVAIHFSHRLGALLVLLVLALTAWQLYRAGLRDAALGVFLALSLQVGLGISNILFSLPLPVAVAHNGGAALLLLAMLYANHRVSTRRGA